MNLWAVEVRSTAGERDAVAVWLVGRTGLAVEERADGLLTGAAVGAAAASQLLSELRSTFGPGIEGSARRIPEIDWSERWRQGLGPRRVGSLVVAPSWAVPADAQRVVVIDPETAFGTGEHGSTRSALLLLDRELHPGDRVLDLGSGSGILAIAAAKLGARRATGIELDPDTEPVARANAERNGVGDRVEFLTGDAAALAGLLGPVELILSNILRTQNERLLPVVRTALSPGGRAIFAGMEVPEREPFLASLKDAAMIPGGEAVDDSWWAVSARPA